MARIRPATKAEIKACREDPRQLDLIAFMQSLPDQALLDEVERRYPLGRQFAQDFNEAFALELEPDEVLEVVREALRDDYVGRFEDDLRELLKRCEVDANNSLM